MASMAAQVRDAVRPVSAAAVGGAVGATIGGGVVAAGSVVLDVATGGANILATPSEVVAGATLGGVIGHTVGEWIDGQSRNESAPEPKESSEGNKDGEGEAKFPPLPENPDELLKQGYKETTTPGALKNGHRHFENPETGDKVRWDKAKPGEGGSKENDHWHRENPDMTSKRDACLDECGKPVPDGSKKSHIYEKKN